MSERPICFTCGIDLNGHVVRWQDHHLFCEACLPKPQEIPQAKKEKPKPSPKQSEENTGVKPMRRFPERNAKMFHPHNGRDGFEPVEPSQELLDAIHSGFIVM